MLNLKKIIIKLITLLFKTEKNRRKNTFPFSLFTFKSSIKNFHLCVIGGKNNFIVSAKTTLILLEFMRNNAIFFLERKNSARKI